MEKQMNSPSEVSMQRSSSWVSKTENMKMEKCVKKSKLDMKIQGLKNVCENISRKRLNGRTYKKLLKSWARVPQLSAGSPRKGDELSGGGGRVIESNGCDKAEETVVERSFSPLKKHRVDCNLEMQISKDNAAPWHRPGDSHSEDSNDFKARHRLEWDAPQSNDTESTNCQMDAEHDKEHIASCSICGLGGELLHCDGKGCNRKFHLYCVDPPFTFAPPGVWYCVWCVQKKIQCGIHSVSKGIRSILDARVVDVDDEGEGKQNQYLVKFRGLAHVHNCWIPETELKKRAKSLVAQFNPQVQGTGSKTEWALPHRLLQKRQLRLPKQCDTVLDEYRSKDLDCQNEWLVKWRGLGYDRATWELETASFMKTPEAAKLMRHFESRHNNANRNAYASEEDEEMKTPSKQMIESPYKGPTGVHSQHENDINKLHKCWSKRQSSVLYDNEERFAKVVLFVLSLRDNNLPFLIVAPCGSLSAWEAEFSRHESSNIVVYNGNNDVRSSIRSLEFYNEFGCIMFQVLLSTPGVVVEDLRILESIKWAGVIVDDCQRPVIFRHLNQIKAVPTDIRLLIANGHITDKSVCKKLLSFISSGIDEEKENASDSDDSDLDDSFLKLKEKLACFTAYECKHQAPRFSEYWVPVKLSNVQLEQYCAALLSNSRFLCSSPRDGSKSLNELLVLERECCGHPYLVDLDHSLQRSLPNDLPLAEHLNAEIEMSGKLQLLDKCLLHIKEKGLRVLIVFQPSVGPGTISAGDVLDDFVFQRFGKDSYARIGGRDIRHSKKRAALELFNNKESGQFVFLLERRACLPNIKLSSVDTVILFDSDWDPLNDFRALQKISLQSQFQPLKVFRLYSVHTVEEKVLILAKQGLAPDNLNNASRSTCHSLLTWGAVHIFDKLDQFHAHNGSDQSPHLSNERCFLNDVLSEFSALLPNNKENISPETNIILKIQQTKGTYVKNASLQGEMEAESMGSISLIERMMHNESTIVFWKNLLEGRCLKWKFLSSSSNMVQTEHTDKLPEETQLMEKAARKICRMVNSASTQLKPVLKRKRSFYADRKGSSSSALGRPPRKKSKSLQDRHDKSPASNGRIGLTSKSKALQDRHDKSPASNEKIGLPLKSKSLQHRHDKGPASNGKIGLPLKSNSLQDRHDKSPASNGKMGLPLETIKADCIPRRVRKKGSSLGKESQFGKADKLIIRDIPASELNATRLTINQPQICPIQGSKGQPHQEQVPMYQSLEDSTAVDDFDYSSILLPSTPALIDQCLDIAVSVNATEPFPSSQKVETLLDCNTQLPQASHIPLEVPHSILLHPQQRDLEIMQKVIEQAMKIMQDTKSRLRAEFEKEIDQVTRKYVKLLDDVEMELSQKKKELEAYYKKVNESKSMIRAFSTNFDSAEAAKSPESQKGAKRSNHRCEQYLAISRSTKTTTNAGLSCASSPIIYPSPSVSHSSHFPVVPHPAVPTNVVPPVTTHHSLTLPSHGPTYHSEILHRENIKPAFGIRAMAPHLRCPRLPAEVSPIYYSQTQNGMLNSPHQTTSSGLVTETTFGSTLSGPQTAIGISSLSTSGLLSQLFTLPKMT